MGLKALGVRLLSHILQTADLRHGINDGLLKANYIL